MAFDAQLKDPCPGQLFGIGRTMVFVAIQAITSSAADMLKDEGSLLLGVTIKADQFAALRRFQAFAARAPVRVMTRNTLHAASAQLVGEGFVLHQFLFCMAITT